jgi:hypothetical protein
MINLFQPASFEENDHENGPLAMLITVNDIFLTFTIIYFTSLMLDLWNYFLSLHSGIFGPFTAT